MVVLNRGEGFRTIYENDLYPPVGQEFAGGVDDPRLDSRRRCEFRAGLPGQPDPLFGPGSDPGDPAVGPLPGDFGHYNRDDSFGGSWNALAQGNLQEFEWMWHRWVVEDGLFNINTSAAAANTPCRAITGPISGF